jgi:hypothetical protein
LEDPWALARTRPEQVERVQRRVTKISFTESQQTHPGNEWRIPGNWNQLVVASERCPTAETWPHSDNDSFSWDEMPPSCSVTMKCCMKKAAVPASWRDLQQKGSGKRRGGRLDLTSSDGTMQIHRDDACTVRSIVSEEGRVNRRRTSVQRYTGRTAVVYSSYCGRCTLE